MNIKLKDLAKSYRPDLVIVQKGEIIYPKTIRAIKNTTKAKVVVWHADSPFRAYADTIVKGLPEYDTCFVFEPYYIPEMIRAGAKKAEYLPFGCDPKVHRGVNLTTEEELKYGSDVVFIGNWQETSQRRKDIIRSLTDFRLKIWGNGWELSQDTKIAKSVMGKAVYGEEMAKVLNASKIAINVHHGQSITGLNMRVFETPACGCFLLTDELSELTNFFKCDEEVVCYKDIADLHKKIRYYLKESGERENIADKGQKRAHNEHTYVKRMEQIIEVVLGT